MKADLFALSPQAHVNPRRVRLALPREAILTRGAGADSKLWMNREALESLDKETLVRLVLVQVQTISAAWRLRVTAATAAMDAGVAPLISFADPTTR
jgi:hypothetical protein